MQVIFESKLTFLFEKHCELFVPPAAARFLFWATHCPHCCPIRICQLVSSAFCCFAGFLFQFYQLSVSVLPVLSNWLRTLPVSSSYLAAGWSPPLVQVQIERCGGQNFRDREAGD